MTNNTIHEKNSAHFILKESARTKAHNTLQILEHRDSRQYSLETLGDELIYVIAISDFIAEKLARYPEWISYIIDIDCIKSPRILGRYREEISKLCAQHSDEEELKKALREYRHYEMIRIIWRDITRRADMLETTQSMSALADAFLHCTLTWCQTKISEKYGGPVCKTSGKIQQMIIIGMGKLGAHELNVSSDIDLIFCYPKQGETDHPKNSLDNQNYFIKVGKKLIQLIDQHTQDGFIFRVDMRLRPFGAAGPLVISIAAIEQYYQEQGREWERYAMIKARAITGDKETTKELDTIIKGFVYRKYIDYSVFDALREMKMMIMREVRRKGYEHNIKLGTGGIREIEFIAQAFQLIRGGKDKQLQQREVLKILPQLSEIIGDEAIVQQLTQAYWFLRNTEHVLQARKDEQTQLLPQDAEEKNILAQAMGFERWNDFNETLKEHRNRVAQVFSDVIALPTDTPSTNTSHHITLWREFLKNEQEDDAIQALLEEAGYSQPKQAKEQLQNFFKSNTKLLNQRITEERLLNVMPTLIHLIGKSHKTETNLERILKILQAIIRRSAYLVLLAENPRAMEQLILLVDASPWFGNLLAKYPVLLDELIDIDSLYAPLDKDKLKHTLRLQQLRIPENDIEQSMEALRYFKQSEVLKIAAAEITHILPIMKVSDYLTWLAETILDTVVDIAWNEQIKKYGYPQKQPGIPSDRDFVIIGFGKLGGIELSYKSDLDMVFIYNADNELETLGERAIPNAVFFNRLGQKIIHILNTFTSSGQLYDVDMRLRPSGASGLLVSSIQAFERYQEAEAWTWEHQALVRARAITGCQDLMEAFESIRKRILCRARETAKVKQEIMQMREKMLQNQEASRKKTNSFNVKQDRGGVIDIEFIVQYLVLSYANTYPSLCQYSDNMRILDSALSHQLLSAEETQTLQRAYQTLRAFTHKHALEDTDNSHEDTEKLQEHTEQVKRIWEKLMS